MSNNDSSAPNPGYFIDFCNDLLPGLLEEVCKVESSLAKQIGKDIIVRAEAFAALNDEAKDVLIAPFIEEVFDHRPDDSSLFLKGAVNVVVRNSMLEDVHTTGQVNSGGIQAITTQATAPLSHFLAARRRKPMEDDRKDLFDGLQEKYPHAWACLATLSHAHNVGGRVGYSSPENVVGVELPGREELIDAVLSKKAGRIVLNAIDPRFDKYTVDQLQMAADQGMPFVVSALSRFSRNQDKLMYIMEFLLTRKVPILTANYMLRTNDVWVRKNLCKPVSDADPGSALSNLDGLTGAHRRAASQIYHALTLADRQ